jgi:Calpain family cysteine protease
MIIEKAWAKLHGNYSRLWGGDTGLAFRVITGAPTIAYGLNKYKKDPRKVNNFNSKAILCISSLLHTWEGVAVTLLSSSIIRVHSNINFIPFPPLRRSRSLG